MFEQIWPELNSRVQKRLRLEAEEELREQQEMNEMREEVQDELREEGRQRPDSARTGQSGALASGEESAL